MSPDETLKNGVGVRVVRWVRRSRDVMLADLEVVDCGSLEVLLYCTDDLVVAGGAPSETDRIASLTAEV